MDEPSGKAERRDSIKQENKKSKILENKKYLGDEDYPQVISEDIALRADEIRETRNKQKGVNKDELIYHLDAQTICPCCGTVMKRRFDPRTKIHGRWKCQSIRSMTADSI